MARPGTITIRAEVLIEVFSDAIESLAEHGFRNFVAVNGHRLTNIPWLQIAAERAQRKLGVKVVIFDPIYMSKEIARDMGFASIGHADDCETSHMLYRYPRLMKMENAKDNPFEPEPLYHMDPREPRDTLCYVPMTPRGLKRVFDDTGDAIFGSPTAATAEKGKKYHDHLVQRLIEVLDMLKG